MQKIGAVILAAGKSTRLKSSTPKVLHEICGKPIVFYPAREAVNAGIEDLVVVAGPDTLGNFEELFGNNRHVSLAVQKKRLGTGDAVKSGLLKISKSISHILIMPGDVPLIKASTIISLVKDTVEKRAVCGVLTMELNDPANYGRIQRDKKGNVKGIVEAKDAAPEDLLIKEVNSGIYFAEKMWLEEALKKIKPLNAQKEYYLTDIVKIAVEEGKKVSAFCGRDPLEFLGINTRKELGTVNRIMRSHLLNAFMNDGVGILDDLHTYIDDGVKIGQDTSVWPHCFILGKTEIGENCTIENGVVIKNCKIGDNVRIKSYSVLEESVIKNNAQVGPFARLRPGSVLEEEVKIGNFVEVKKSLIKRGAKASHLSYIGDAEVGKNSNIGCGTITCNYDGQKKHKTVIGDEAFVGSDVAFVAPVKIGNKTVIGAGSVITEDVPNGTLAIARGKQINKTRKS